MARTKRRLKKPIRVILQFAVYAVMATVADIMVVCTYLQVFEGARTAVIIGTCMAMNIVLQYLFFRKEMCMEK